MIDKELPAKTVNTSAVRDQIYRIFPNDLNANNTVFGGLVMALLDRLCSVVGERHTGRICVTASVDSMNFIQPAHGGEILVLASAINRCWRTSMEIGAKVMAENYQTGEKKHIVSAYFTFVALDEQQKPVKVPQVIPESADEIRRYAEADVRRTRRRA